MRVSDESIEAVVSAFAEACAQREGFYVTEDEAKESKMRYPTVAVRNNNPLRLPVWGSYPVRDGCANFVKVSRGKVVSNLEAGWRAAKFLVRKNIVERRLSFYSFFVGERDVNGAIAGYPGFCASASQDYAVEYAKHVLQVLKEKKLVADLATVHSTILSVINFTSNK